MSSHPQTIREALALAAGELTGSESPWLDATVLLGFVTGLSREKILASFPDPLSPEHFKRFMELAALRKEGHPVAYLTGEKEFYGRPFMVEEGILCPRPDTEILVDEALGMIRREGYSRVHDLCTGSGCIALTLALEHPGLTVSASDISPRSEAVFLRNRERLQAEADFTRTSLFEGIEGPFDLIVSNPPYLTTDETDQRMDEGWKEPSLALDGGGDGLDLIRTIIEQAPGLLNPGGRLMIEAASPQMETMADLYRNAGMSDIRILQDLGNRDRVITGKKTL